jgi:hypothetical protein
MTLDAKSSPLQASPELARLAKLSYTPKEPSGYRFDKAISVGESQARVFANKTVGIIAVTGTSDLYDWSISSQTGVYRYNDRIGVHTGFYKAATSILAGVLSLDLPGCFHAGNYWLTGHSLGAAVSAVMTLLAAEETKIGDPVGYVGFGCPRYVEGDSSLLFRTDRMLTVTDPEDPVSHVPRKLCRAGMQVYISEDGFTCHSGSEVKRLAGYAFRAMRLQWVAGKTSVANHAMTRYERLVSRALDKLDR